MMRAYIDIEVRIIAILGEILIDKIKQKREEYQAEFLRIYPFYRKWNWRKFRRETIEHKTWEDAWEHLRNCSGLQAAGIYHKWFPKVYLDINRDMYDIIMTAKMLADGSNPMQKMTISANAYYSFYREFTLLGGTSDEFTKMVETYSPNYYKAKSKDG